MNYTGVMTPIILGNDRIIYPAYDGGIYMTDVDGNKTELDFDVRDRYYPIEQYSESLIKNYMLSAWNGKMFANMNYFISEINDFGCSVIGTDGNEVSKNVR